MPMYPCDSEPGIGMPQPTPEITQSTMREAISRKEFFLEYLPTVVLEDRTCVGAEALIRWQHPSGLLPPGAFIPLAEKTPLAGLLTYWVIETVAEELGSWLESRPAVHVSINVPPEILGRGGMEYAAEKTGLIRLASQLVIEVTERGLPDIIGLEALNDMWGRGLQVALDDATLLDAAHLVVLLRCHFTWLKLDRSLTAMLTPDNPRPPWLQGLQALLTATPIRVIAEGVETEFQAAALREAGVPYAQGFLFSKPIPVQKFQDYHELHRSPPTRAQPTGGQ
jgi:sensor c-di-GMP phosphodiesterase-like protein